MAGQVMVQRLDYQGLPFIVHFVGGLDIYEETAQTGW
jgi:hypothetical protein